MITIERIDNIIILNVFNGNGWDRIPCANDDELNIQFHRLGVPENGNIWNRYRNKES